LKLSIFPQLFVNNPGGAVRRGVTPAEESLLLPVELSKRVGPVDVNLETGYQLSRHGPNGFLTGLVVGHDFTSKLEGDVEFYNQGPFHFADNQPTIGVGGRYKLHSPIIVLFMAGRGLESTAPQQGYFIGYFGLQFLLPPKSYNSN
jgi:hypothetical protein